MFKLTLGMSKTPPMGVRNEPLKQFGVAKNGMGNIYTDLGAFVSELANNFAGLYYFYS